MDWSQYFSPGEKTKNTVLGTGALLHPTEEDVRETSVRCWSQEDWKQQSAHAFKMGGLITVFGYLQNKPGSCS